MQEAIYLPIDKVLASLTAPGDLSFQLERRSLDVFSVKRLQLELGINDSLVLCT